MHEDTIRIDEDGVLWIGPRSFPNAQLNIQDSTVRTRRGERMIHIRKARITLPNRWVISLTWDGGSYCENYQRGIYGIENNEAFNETPGNAEIAAWNPRGWWYSWDHKRLITGTEVLGYVEPQRILDYIDEISNYPTDIEFHYTGADGPPDYNEGANDFGDEEEDLPDDEV